MRLKNALVCARRILFTKKCVCPGAAHFLCEKVRLGLSIAFFFQKNAFGLPNRKKNAFGLRNRKKNAFGLYNRKKNAFGLRNGQKKCV